THSRLVFSFVFGLLLPFAIASPARGTSKPKNGQQEISYNLPADPKDGGSCPVNSRNAVDGWCYFDVSMIAFHFGQPESVQGNSGHGGIARAPIHRRQNTAVGIMCCVPNRQLEPFVKQYKAQYKMEYPTWNGQTVLKVGLFKNSAGTREPSRRFREKCRGGFGAFVKGCMEDLSTARPGSGLSGAWF
ncbi:hypothetical protein PoMZ_04928, partial [Pyricularia oryzae]